MKAKQTNLIVGSKVLVDWPIRWKEARPEYRDRLKAEAAAKEERFGETAVVVAYNPNAANAKDLTLRFEDGRLGEFYDQAVTVIEPPPADRTEELLKQILEALRQLKHVTECK